MRTALFWRITLRVLVVSHRRFGTTYRSNLQWLTLEDGTDRLSRNIGNKLLLFAERVRKISPPPGFDPLTVQPVASRYNDYAIPAHSWPPLPAEINIKTCCIDRKNSTH
jgi:hypothetical protein